MVMQSPNWKKQTNIGSMPPGNAYLKSPYFQTSSKQNSSMASTGRGVSEKVSAVGFCLGSGLFGSCNSD